jgi:hypothetical protein
MRRIVDDATRELQTGNDLSIARMHADANGVLPDNFMRIRHYGFLSNGNRKKKLAIIRKLLGARPPEPPAVQSAAEWLESVLGIDPSQCPCCGAPLRERELQPDGRPKPHISTSPRQPRAPPQAVLP